MLYLLAGSMELHTPKRNSQGAATVAPSVGVEGPMGSPSMGDNMLYPWNWGEEARNVNLSPGSSCSSPEYHGGGPGSGNAHVQQQHRGLHQEHHRDRRESHRRGRPRADALTNLMMQGSTSPSSIKCTFCNRVFPREKSLQAHLRTHTGELCLGYGQIFIQLSRANISLHARGNITYIPRARALARLVRKTAVPLCTTMQPILYSRALSLIPSPFLTADSRVSRAP